MVRIIKEQILYLCARPWKADINVSQKALLIKTLLVSKTKLVVPLLGLVWKLCSNNSLPEETIWTDHLMWHHLKGRWLEKIKFRKTADSYGCYNWQPPVAADSSEIEKATQYNYGEFVWETNIRMVKTLITESMSITLSVQRQMIIGGASIHLLKENWPFLFHKKGMLVHYERLMGKKWDRYPCERAGRFWCIKIDLFKWQNFTKKQVLPPYLIVALMLYFKEPATKYIHHCKGKINDTNIID